MTTMSQQHATLLLLHSLLLIGYTRSDTCGQDRKVLGDWFIEHGSTNLLEAPIPSLVSNVTKNPYQNQTNPPPSRDVYCAMQWSSDTDPVIGKRKYRLRDFKSEEAAARDNFTVTHKGHCGSCSSIQDLGVYIRQNLTDATRSCAIKGMLSDRWERNCLRQLGFSEECVTIWYYNILNTRRKCLVTCLLSKIRKEPFNRPDGSLNSCLQCDEDKSGPNFKYFSGRTRRNSGIPSAILRPESQIYHMEHCYWYGNL